MPKVGVILSGCGVYDGSEIHEAVAVLHALDRHGVQAVCLAPEMELEEINHLNQQPTGKKRSVLMEAARIARGDVTPLAKVKGSDFDAIVLPGGFGAAKNLCDFASKGPDCTVNEQVARVLKEAQQAGRPLGFACISPAVAARVFGKDLGPNLTIGRDKGTADGLEAMGATHQDCEGDGIVVDNRHRIVSTPAYMCDQPIGAVFTGIGAMVDKVMEMVEQPAAV
ncbi:isoprenoid biosynthesis protein ElbB [Leptolyngbya valderiana BDU 20041]|nr:isoprenoid biosynthesis protein ElbB [Leptolyngbya valderiana BDU 20041]